MQYQLVTQLATCVILTGNMQISVNINCKEVLIEIIMVTDMHLSLAIIMLYAHTIRLGPNPL